MSNWIVENIEVLADTYAGGTPSRSNPEYFKGDIPWISSGEVNQSKIQDTQERITEDALRNSSAKWIPKNSVLVAMYGATAGQVSTNLIDATSNQAVLALIPFKDIIESEFLYYSLTHNKHAILFLTQGTGQPNLSKGLIDSFSIRLPKSLAEQRHIARILSTADSVIEKTQSAIAKYKAIKQGMLQDLFTRGIDLNTGKLRPRYQDAPGLYKPARPSGGESKLGMIPREWEEKKLSNYLVFISYGFTNPMPETQDGPFLVTAANVNGGRIQYETARKTSRFAFDNLLTDKSRPKVNDILLTKDGTLGRIAIVEKENLCINQSVAVLRPNKLVNPIFLKILLESPTYQKIILDDSRGSAIKHIYITDVDKMVVVFPSIDEQGKIAERLTAIDTKLQTEQTYLQKMQSLKKGLMEDLLSGRKCLNLDFQDEQINQDSKTILHSVNLVNQDADNYPVNPKIE